MVHQKVKCRHAKRRHKDMVKLLQRKALMHSLGQQGGMVYEKHIKKINQSLGYMRDGNVTHFVQAGFRQKTRDRGRCGPVVRYSPHDQRAADETWQQEEAEKGSLLAERDRLLYVAATRAANALIIGDILKTDGVRSDVNPWRFFAERSEGDIFAHLGSSALYDPPTEKRSASSLYEHGDVLDLTAFAPRVKSFEILRPSMIKTKAITASEDEFEDAEDEAVRTDRRKRNPALVGTIVHRLMEMLVSSGNKIDLDKAVQEIAWDYEAEEAYYTDILKRVGKTVRNGGFPQETVVPQDILQELVNSEEVHCEVPFCYREGDERIWHGVMDVLYKKDGRWHIIDYKTNADPSDLDEKYQEQMKAYVAAFREMTGEEADAVIYHISV